jgi:trimeric autotransporter adhesin
METAMTKFPVLILTLATLLQAMPLSDTCNQNTWVTNGPVYAIVPAGDKIYIGGQFTYVWLYTGGWVPINSSTGAPAPAFPNINGSVHAVCADGNGGWFVGGAFTSVGGVARNNIAHILSSGSVDPAWDPNASFIVYSLALSGTTVYAGGSFSSIGGQSRNYIAALDATTGNATSWNPDASSSIFSLVVNAATVYAGGGFTSIGGQNRNRIAALDATTGNAMAWDPNADAEVQAIVVSGTTVYAGGEFGIIGGQSRYCIAALDATTGNVLAWNANASGCCYGVKSLTLSGTTLYVGGGFNSIGGQSRNNIAALDAITGNALAWNPNASGISPQTGVYSLAVSGTTVYAGGNFTSVGGQSRNNIAALDATTGDVLPWNPNANNWVYSLAVSGTAVYAGGQFTGLGGQRRNFIAAFDATTGKATDWDPNANGGVVSLAVSGTTVYAGGSFDSIGGQGRNNIAALDATTGNASAWNPSADSSVSALAVSGTTVYAGGRFDSIGGQNRNCIAALDATTGSALAWNPNASRYFNVGPNVASLAVSGTTVYVGGTFGGIGGQSRNNIAALDATTGNALAWNPNANGCCGVKSLVVSGTTIYAGGEFGIIGGQSRGNIAALDATTGNALAWAPNASVSKFSPSVYSLAVSGTTVYAGGWFDRIGGQSRNDIAALDAITGNALAWAPNTGTFDFVSGVYSLAVSGKTLYVGGNFTHIGQGVGHAYFAQFDSQNSAPEVQPITPSSGLNHSGLQIIGSNFHAGAFVKFVYSLPKAEHVSLRLYSLNGQLQSELINKHQPAGNYSLNLQRGNLATGAYLVSFRAGDYHQEKIISLMR